MGMFTSGYYDQSDAELEADERLRQQWADAEKKYGYYFIMDEKSPTAICRTCYTLVPGNHYRTEYLAEHQEWHRRLSA